MKHYTLLFVLLTSYSYSHSQKTVPGFYVSNTKDTVTAQIKIPKSIFGSEDLSKLFFKVEIIDSINGIKKFKPGDIKSFGFFNNEKQYRFFSKPAISNNNLRFLQPVILAQKTNLYQFQTANQNGALLGTFYTFEKEDGTYTFLSTGIKNLGKFRETLKEFYKDNLEIQQLVDTKFKTRTAIHHDIIEIVRAVNRQ